MTQQNLHHKLTSLQGNARNLTSISLHDAYIEAPLIEGERGRAFLERFIKDLELSNLAKIVSSKNFSQENILKFNVLRKSLLCARTNLGILLNLEKEELKTLRNLTYYMGVIKDRTSLKGMKIKKREERKIINGIRLLEDLHTRNDNSRHKPCSQIKKDIGVLCEKIEKGFLDYVEGDEKYHSFRKNVRRLAHVYALKGLSLEEIPEKIAIRLYKISQFLGDREKNREGLPPIYEDFLNEVLRIVDIK